MRQEGSENTVKCSIESLSGRTGAQLRMKGSKTVTAELERGTLFPCVAKARTINCPA
jgi:hypothetical protein